MGNRSNDSGKQIRLQTFNLMSKTSQMLQGVALCYGIKSIQPADAVKQRTLPPWLK